MHAQTAPLVKSWLLLILVLIAPSLQAKEASWFYIEPKESSHFDGAYGKGKLKICKSRDEANVDYSKKMFVPAGTYFDDMGPLEKFDLSKPQQWLLTVVTIANATFKLNQQCAIVSAKVTFSGPPLSHPELKEVRRFDIADKRYFEISGSKDINSSLPNLAPWSVTYPSLNATAATDFK